MSWNDIWNGVKTAATWSGNKIVGALKPAKADLGLAQGQKDISNKTATDLAAERNAFAGFKAPQMDKEQIDRGDINAWRTQQQTAIDALKGAANGTVASAAELQGRAAADRAGAQQFGQAAALQGRNAGAALRQASMGSAQVLGEANQQAGILRAQEQANARNALVGALQGVRGQDQGLATDQAGLNQGANMANLGANVQGMNLGEDWRKALLSGQLGSQGQAAGLVGAQLGASAANAQSENAYKGELIGGTAKGLMAISDKDAKKDIEDVSDKELTDTMEALKPKTFAYKDASNGAGPRVGVLAQDVAKAPLGDSMVVKGKPMSLDVGNALGMALAGLHELNGRLQKLEGKKA